MSHYRFPPKTLLLGLGLCSLLIVVGVALWNGLADARPASVRNDYLEGRISLEEARQELGDVVDTWTEWTHERATLKRKQRLP